MDLPFRGRIGGSRNGEHLTDERGGGRSGEVAHEATAFRDAERAAASCGESANASFSVGCRMSRKTRCADRAHGPGSATISKIVGDVGAATAEDAKSSAYLRSCSSDPSATSTLRPVAISVRFFPRRISVLLALRGDTASRWDPAPAERKRLKLTTRSLFPLMILGFGMIVPSLPEPLLQRLGAATKL